MPAIQPQRPDLVIPFDQHDLGMNGAIAHARATLVDFFRAYGNPKPNQSAFCLKVRFETIHGGEHIWLADIDASKEPMEGTVGNEPNDVPGLTFMQRVRFQLSDVTDWMYLEDGRLIGGFTIKQIRSAYSPEERARRDAESPYIIGEDSKKGR